MSELVEVFKQHIESPALPPPRADVNAARRVAFVPEIRAIDESKRTIEFVASTETPDRYKDILRVSGWQTKNYLRNPVVLWAHRSSDPPIGRTLSLRTEANPPALVQVVEFADAATYPFADQIFQLYKQKFLRSVSVGFRSLASPVPILDENGTGTGGYEFTSMELLELSCVPIPANVDAVARAIDGGLITAADADKYFTRQGHVDLEDRLAVLEGDMATLKLDVGRLLRGADVETLDDLELLLKGEER